MMYVVVKQPNGKYSLWSDYDEDFLLIDVTKAEMVELAVENEMRFVKEKWVREIDRMTDQPAAMCSACTKETVEMINRRWKGDRYE